MPARRSAVVAVALAAVMTSFSGVTVAAPTPSGQVRTYDKQLLKYVNHARAQNGLKPLVQSNRLYKMAHAWAEHLAKTGVLEHNPNFGYGAPLITKRCPNATIAGENVGEQDTSDPKQLFDLYMAEPYHKANILQPKYNSKGTPKYTQVGIATVTASDGSEWNVMDFANHCG